MAQAREDHTGTQDVVRDYDAIHRVLELCTEGEAKGDAAKLREAFHADARIFHADARIFHADARIFHADARIFHADARMFGSLAGERYDVPIEELFKLAESAPADTGSYRSRVLSVQQTGDAAAAVVAEEGYWGTASFVDYFSLVRIDGAWKIVCKAFAHTAGEPPEGI